MDEITQRAEMVLVTPELAKEMLSRNFTGNRKLRKSYCDQLAQVMLSGRYVSQNGQTIVIGADDGVLYDGQHRLTAIAMSGVPMPLLVVYVKGGQRAYETIDNGARRVAADLIDAPNKKLCAAVAKNMACVEWGSAQVLLCFDGRINNGADTIDRGLVIDYFNQHREQIIGACHLAKACSGVLGRAISGSLIGSFYLVMKYCRNDFLLDEFISDIALTAPKNRTIVAFKEKAMKVALSTTGKPDRRWQLGTLLNAYVHYKAMDNSVLFNKQAQMIERLNKAIDATRNRLRLEVV